MKINKGFELREMCGEHIIIATGVENIDFSKVISLNESAAYLWHAVKDQEFTLEQLVHLLTAEYDIDETTALADVSLLVDRLKSEGVVAD